jgi:hypothetical protein
MITTAHTNIDYDHGGIQCQMGVRYQKRHEVDQYGPRKYRFVIVITVILSVKVPIKGCDK